MNSIHASEPLDTTVLDVFDAWAAQTPFAIAAVFAEETITYAELRCEALQVNWALLLAGVQPQDRILLLTDMSLDMLPAVIGILRVGACFAPIDIVAWGRPRTEAALSELSSSMALVTRDCPGLQLPISTINFQK